MHEDKKLNMHISLIWLSFTLVGLVHSCNITDVDTKMFYDLSPLIADPLYVLIFEILLQLFNVSQEGTSGGRRSRSCLPI